LGAKLAEAAFQGANLAGAVLDGADLGRANLDRVRAVGASFATATAPRGKFRQASLRRSSFAGADLRGADFSAADLTGADFTGAVLDGTTFDRARFDEKTTFPPGFVPPREMVWKGRGPRPGPAPVVVAEPGGMDFDTFYRGLTAKVEPARVAKALAMLQAASFQLFAEVSPDGVIGVVKSQSTDERVYSCRLAANGTFGCCTQNLLICGGLRGALCKHLLVLIIGLTRAGELDPATADAWTAASLSQKPDLDKEVMSEAFLKYKGAEAGQIDWRPTETIPEDFYAV
jgi:hypothetical protein